MKPTTRIKKKECKHQNCYMTIYGKYYCPDCDDMFGGDKKSVPSLKKTTKEINKAIKEAQIDYYGCHCGNRRSDCLKCFPQPSDLRGKVGRIKPLKIKPVDMFTKEYMRFVEDTTYKINEIIEYLNSGRK